MNHIRHLAGILAALAGALPAFGALAPGALAARQLPRGSSPAAVTLRPEPPGFFKHPPLPGPAQVHHAVAAGMPGWQVALIVAGAALLAAMLPVLLGSARAARGRTAARTV